MGGGRYEGAIVQEEAQRRRMAALMKRKQIKAQRPPLNIATFSGPTLSSASHYLASIGGSTFCIPVADWSTSWGEGKGKDNNRHLAPSLKALAYRTTSPLILTE